MPESGLPIRVHKEHDLWHVDYGEGEVEDHTGREDAESAADAVARAEERTVVVED
jgi:pyrroloquinoline quinone (PQQ) biosynthesis protein C